MIDKLKDIIGAIRKTDPEARIFGQDVKALEQMVDMGLKALEESGDKSAIGSRKFSSKNINLDGRDYSYEAFMKKGNVTITDLDNEPLKKDGRFDRAATIRKALENIQTQDSLGRKYIYNNDTDSKIYVGIPGLRHSMDRRVGTIIYSVANIKAVLENSILLNTAERNTEYSDSSYILVGIGRKGKDIYISHSVIERVGRQQYALVDITDNLHAINIKEAGVRLIAKGAEALLPPSFSSSVINISDFLEYVKNYFATSLPIDVWEHYNAISPLLKRSSRLKHSLKNIDQDFDAKALVKENEQLRQAVELLKHEFKSTLGNRENDLSKIRQLSRSILKEYRSKYDADTLTANLDKIFSYIRNSETVAWEEVFDAIGAISKEVLDEASVRVARRMSIVQGCGVNFIQHIGTQTYYKQRQSKNEKCG